MGPHPPPSWHRLCHSRRRPLPSFHRCGKRRPRSHFGKMGPLPHCRSRRRAPDPRWTGSVGICRPPPPRTFRRPASARRRGPGRRPRSSRVSPFTFFAEHRAEIFGATLDHLALVVIAMLIAILIGVPLGMFIVQRPALRAIALGVAGIFQTVPSLALFGFLIPIPFIGGIGKRTAIVALVLYALLPILRNTYVGLTGIDPAVLEAAEAMGMTRAQTLFRVRFPLALAVILAGIRTATIITIGVATIAAAIGAGGLGTFIFRGVALVSDALILAGAIPAALLALLADFLLGLLERRLKVS